MSTIETSGPDALPDTATDVMAADQPSPVLPIEALERAAASGPTLLPPGEDLGITADSGISATEWVDATVSAMWANGPAKAAYAALQGRGWCRIGGTAAAKLSLTMILSMAEQTGATCKIRLVDNVITRAYVF